MNIYLMQHFIINIMMLVMIITIHNVLIIYLIHFIHHREINFLIKLYLILLISLYPKDIYKYNTIYFKTSNIYGNLYLYSFKCSNINSDNSHFSNYLNFSNPSASYFASCIRNNSGTN